MNSKKKKSKKNFLTFDSPGTVDVGALYPTSSSVVVVRSAALFVLFLFLLPVFIERRRRERPAAALHRGGRGRDGVGGMRRLCPRGAERPGRGDERLGERPPPLRQDRRREAVEARLLLEFLEETVFEFFFVCVKGKRG